MGVKSLAFLGIVISSLFIYLCISSKKDSLYAQIAKKDTSHHDQAITQIKKEPKKEAVITHVAKELKEPSFTFISTKEKIKIAAVFSNKDKDTNVSKMINQLCGNKGCTDDVKYFDDIKEFSFTQETLNLMQRSVEQNITDLNFAIKDKNLTLAGIATQKENIDALLKACDPFIKGGYKLNNNLKLMKKKIEKVIPAIPKTAVVKKEVIENQAKSQKVALVKAKNEQAKEKKVQKPKESAKPVVKKVKTIKPKIEKAKKVVKKKAEVHKRKKAIHKTPKVIKDVKVEDVFDVSNRVDPLEAAYRIEDILNIEPISFDESHHISDESKISLNKIANIIKELHGVRVVVFSHSNRQESETYANVLTQKRADVVRSYLISRGVNGSIIKSYGKGDKELISDPYDDINNRIEIQIKER